MGICLGDNEYALCRRCAPICFFKRAKMLCDFKRSTEKVGLRIHPRKTKILSNQSSNSRKEIEIDNIKVEILTKKKVQNILARRLYSSNRRRPRSRIAVGLLGRHQELTSKSYLLRQSTSLIRHRGHPNDELRLRNMDPHKRERKNDPIDAAQNAGLIIQTKRKYNKDPKQR